MDRLRQLVVAKRNKQNKKSGVAGSFALSSARLRPIEAAFHLNVRVVFMLHTPFHAAAPQGGVGVGVTGGRSVAIVTWGGSM